MMPLKDFLLLSEEAKHLEVLKCLPLLVPLGEDLTQLREGLTTALEKLDKVDRQNEGEDDDRGKEEAEEVGTRSDAVQH